MPIAALARSRFIRNLHLVVFAGSIAGVFDKVRGEGDDIATGR
jgi:hypothetical protein